MNYTPHFILIGCLVLILFLLLYIRRLLTGRENYTLQEKKTIEKYQYLPKAGNGKRTLLFLALVLLIALMSCSPTASLPNGCKYKLIAPKFTK